MYAMVFVEFSGNSRFTKGTGRMVTSSDVNRHSVGQSVRSASCLFVGDENPLVESMHYLDTLG